MENITKYLLWVYMINLALISQAQHITADFEMQLFFEDAIGNKDTLEIGYDTSAENTLNPGFGEIPMIQPFDSVFEVRATHDWQTETLKRIIDRSEYDDYSGCESSNGIWIFFSARNFPITITYDSAHLNSTSCHTDVVLSPTWTIYTYPDWRDAEMLFCLSTTNSIVDDFSYYFDYPSAYLQRQFEVEGEGVKFLPGYFFIIFWPSGNCESLVGTSELTTGNFSVFPNPTQSQITVTWTEAYGRTITMVDLYGQAVLGPYYSTWSELDINISNLPAGQYFVIVADQRQITTKRLIIID